MEPATDSPLGLLLLAHGERLDGADNGGAFRLKADLTARGIVAEIRLGFINGAPTIAEALDEFEAPRVLVYPLLMSAGYFARKGLRELREAQATARRKRTVDILPVLGLDPALAGIAAARASAAIRPLGVAPAEAILVLMAHGSTRDSASQIATDTLAGRIGRLGLFADVRTAYLDQAPSLAEAISSSRAPAVVVGLFAGEGLHGGVDVARTIAETGRPGIAFAGNAGNWPEIATVVARAVEREGQSAGDLGMSAARGGDPPLRESPI
jgi:sirohydrochlorin ferrochelatase